MTMRKLRAEIKKAKDNANRIKSIISRLRQRNMNQMATKLEKILERLSEHLDNASNIVKVQNDKGKSCIYHICDIIPYAISSISNTVSDISITILPGIGGQLISCIVSPFIILTSSSLSLYLMGFKISVSISNGWMWSVPLLCNSIGEILADLFTKSSQNDNSLKRKIIGNIISAVTMVIIIPLSKYISKIIKKWFKKKTIKISSASDQDQ